jgi:hypothetical protein
MTISRIIVFLAGVALAAAGAAWADCAVLDPELQAGYAGGCRDGLADGAGAATGTAEYKGEFRSGRKHGKGLKTWQSTGDRYEGDFVADRKEGAGVYVWGPRSAWAGEKYAGAYVNDRREGRGVYEWPNGERYDGTWKDDAATGVPTGKMLARARTLDEQAATVARPGVRVCRELKVGIGTPDWVRGTVTQAAGGNIAVRIDDAGQYRHMIGQSPVTKGAIVQDSVVHWLPCWQ